jgi:hypothetical protein
LFRKRQPEPESLPEFSIYDRITRDFGALETSDSDGTEPGEHASAAATPGETAEPGSAEHPTAEEGAAERHLTGSPGAD